MEALRLVIQFYRSALPEPPSLFSGFSLVPVLFGDAAGIVSEGVIVAAPVCVRGVVDSSESSSSYSIVSYVFPFELLETTP